MAAVLPNHEIVVIAAFLAGATREPADTEDIAIKANEIAPGRFTWRKYPDQINIDTVRKRLWDACKPEKGGYLAGSERKGWLLTEAGLAFAKRRRKFMQSQPVTRISLNEKAWRRIERARLLSTDAYRKVKSGTGIPISLREAQGFFRIDTYVSKEARQKKILRLLSAFGDDRDLGPIVKRLAEMVRSVDG